MAKISFIKVDSLGNDFVIIEPGSAKIAWAATICDRRKGIGSDGLILLGPAKADGIRFRLFNADGSSAEWSGNGVRGAGAYLAAMNPKQHEFHIDTLAGCIRVGTKRLKSGGVSTSFSRPTPHMATVPPRSSRPIAAMAGRHLLAGPVFVDAGNPHWVFVVSGFKFDWENLGAECQNLNRKTGGINVEFAHVRSRHQLELRIFERGVGPTPSSGSGALAAVAACRAMDFVDTSLKVVSPGGDQSARFSPSGESITLEAPARIVMAGVWSDSDVFSEKKR